MLTVNHYELIRRAVLIDGLSEREAARKLNHSRNTIAKALRHPAPPGYRLSKERSRPSVEPFRAFVEQTGTVTVRRAHGIFSNDLLVATYYPDKTSGSASASEAERYTLNALGERLHMTDRRGNVHDYQRDLVGRITRDHIYSLGADTDGTVRSLYFKFDTAGRLYTATSKSSNLNPDGCQVIVNQVMRLYNDFGQLVTEYQEHTGAVITSTSAKVQYGYT
jgi:hypothetical protein